MWKDELWEVGITINMAVFVALLTGIPYGIYKEGFNNFTYAMIIVFSFMVGRLYQKIKELRK